MPRIYASIAILSMLTVGQDSATTGLGIAIWAMDMDLSKLTVEVHFVPLPAQEAEERTRRLRTLLLRGALRFAERKHEEVDECVLAQKVSQ
jgi:hypothetical protein